MPHIEHHYNQRTGWLRAAVLGASYRHLLFIISKSAWRGISKSRRSKAPKRNIKDYILGNSRNDYNRLSRSCF